MEIAAYICGALTVVAGIVAALALGLHHRDLSIWTSCAAIVFVVLGVFCWVQDRQWKNDAVAIARASEPPPVFPFNPLPTPRPSAAASQSPPLAPPPTVTPETKSDTPNVDEMTPEEVGRKLSEAHKQGKAQVIKNALVGMRVKWKLSGRQGG